MNEYGFPERLGPFDTADGGSWSAELDGFNARNEHLYYLVTRSDADGVQWAFFVRIGLWGEPPHVERFRAAIQPHAESGGRNTDYAGNMMKWLPARKAEAKARAAREAERDE